ncbi:hypothetical protein E4U19_008064 [Claviceps sp. Clav32 group G5]|nr:hypothetical protein E4U19_008064 [Claviceps sp. Clav32 group G5]
MYMHGDNPVTAFGNVSSAASAEEYGSQTCSYSNQPDEYCSEPENEVPDAPCFNSDQMDKDYSEFFISHAKVHVFAQYYE